MEQNLNYYNVNDNLDENININYKKNLKALQSRRKIMYVVMLITFIIFVSWTYIAKKVYTVDADLFINSKNSSNISDINPYVLDETNSGFSSMGVDKAMNNELEIIQSPWVIQKVIKENNLRYKKLYKLIPTVRTGKYLTTESFLKKGIKFKIKKGSNVINITYKSKDRKLAYSVVNSIINDYIALHKEINSKKSQADKELLESKYNKAKTLLDSKNQKLGGIPATAITGNGELAAMSAFSSSARKALSSMTSRVYESERARREISDEADKVKQLAARLQWAELVADMDNASKVFVLKEPKLPEVYEQTSPRLLIQIILGIIFGIIFAIITAIQLELQDKKLSYLMLGENVIYDLNNELNYFKSLLISNNNSKIGVITFEDIPKEIKELIKSYKNVDIFNAEISEEFKLKLDRSDKIVLFEKIKHTDTELYQIITDIVKNQKKEIITEVLL